jgi:homocitrate synthase NifV
MKTSRHALWIIDTTLRDGEQAPGVVFNRRHKRVIAQLLDRAGVDELEAGTPAMGETVMDDMRAMARLGLTCRLTAWCRARHEDIQAAACCGVDGVHISFPASARHMRIVNLSAEQVCRRLPVLVAEARQRFGHVSVGAQDATRADPEFLKEFCRLAHAAGAARVRLADTVGIARPFTVAALIRHLTRQVTGIALEFHAHNDKGMATANTITAAECGVDAVSVTVNGLGERAGNASLAEVGLALRDLPHRPSKLILQHMRALSLHVARATRRPLAPDKPVVGRNAFSHESGIHCAGQLKDQRAYEPFAPAVVGRRGSKLVMGRHSGSAGLLFCLQQAGVQTDQTQIRRLREKVAAASLRKGDCLTIAEVLAIYQGSQPASR